jgi:flagellar hook-length control protein FliK
MKIRLDPPELGALSLTVRMHEGVMTASFQTSSEEATRLLSHSLSDLKTSLESQGVSVARLHVEQAPKDSQPQTRQDSNSQKEFTQDSSARQEQQRREMIRRMWQKLRGIDDPLDMVA